MGQVLRELHVILTAAQVGPVRLDDGFGDRPPLPPVGAVVDVVRDDPLDGVADDTRLARYQPLHAARAELLSRAGDLSGADAAYAEAIALTANEAERAALERRRAMMGL